jgi:hypothetical protein
MLCSGQRKQSRPGIQTQAIIEIPDGRVERPFVRYRKKTTGET